MIRGLGDILSSTYSQTLNGFVYLADSLSMVVQWYFLVGQFW
jgi:hypothetical protein